MLSDVLDDYIHGTDTERKKIITGFLHELWNSKYKFRTFTKEYTYEIDKNILQKYPQLIQLFQKYQTIQLRYCKSYHQGHLDSIDYIRIHINNMYGYLIKENLYLPKEYYRLMLSPKHVYYQVIKNIKNGKEVDDGGIIKTIETSLLKADQIKKQCNRKKLELTWNQYKTLINGYIQRIFNNYSPTEEYEESHGWELKVMRDYWSEDNYVISYFCKSLTGYMRTYIRDAKRKKKRKKNCVICGKTFICKNTTRLYCDECKKNVHREKNKKYMRQMRKK